MRGMAFLSGSTAAFGAVGFYTGCTIYGPTSAALVPTLAGAAGGFGIGCAVLDVLRRWRAARASSAKLDAAAL
ncbi:MAG TPA: hypothetical protein VMZ71_14555 [Gemmataceae bacterium]|nr:hypothetical protein [Gemmataceae bacterium]